MNSKNPTALGLVISLTVTSALCAQTIDWSSEGTFDASALPAGSAVNTFSSASAFDFVDVNFGHMVAANADLSELVLSDGKFAIAAANGDQLHGEYNDFVYALRGDTGNYDGVGGFNITGGTGMFAGATGGGIWSALAKFTSSTGGTADHQWMGNLVLPELSVDWSSEGTFDASALPTGSAVNTFATSSAFDFGDVNFSHTVAANADLSVLTLLAGEFSIAAGNGDTLRGRYDDFVYTLGNDGETYHGVGDFSFSGGTGMFAGATGGGSWSALAKFTSAIGGTAAHDWIGSLRLVPKPVVGDFDGDGQLSSSDIDLLSTALGSGDTRFDLDGDGTVQQSDRGVWVEDVFGTLYGDANLNKTVEFVDFLSLSDNFSKAGGWAQGDFDGSGDIQFADFTLLSANFGKSVTQAATVPEPDAAMLLLLGFVGVVQRFSRRAEY